VGLVRGEIPVGVPFAEFSSDGGVVGFHAPSEKCLRCCSRLVARSAALLSSRVLPLDALGFFVRDVIEERKKMSALKIRT
jgi:hypothetical protein